MDVGELRGITVGSGIVNLGSSGRVGGWEVSQTKQTILNPGRKSTQRKEKLEVCPSLKVLHSVSWLIEKRI